MSIEEAVRHYVHNTVPARPVAIDVPDSGGVVYENHYTWCPPPLGMVIISVAEVREAS
jgi:hypothetical protein